MSGFEHIANEEIETLKEQLEKAECVVIGSGAGLSASAGFSYSGERFKKYFSDFETKYHFHDMYSGGFTDFCSLEENWAYWSRYIYINRYMRAPLPVYEKLFELLRGKDYFAITTNVDHCFQKAGFDKKRLFYTQDDYGLFQCCVPCHKKTYDNEEAVKRYQDFIEKHKNARTLFLELGVGGNTPGIIKYPFWNLTYKNKNAFYAAVNMEKEEVPAEIKSRSVLIKGDIFKTIESLM